NLIFADDIILFSQIELPKFYTNRDFELAWANEKNRNDLLQSILSSFDEGLNPKDYHLEKITKLIEKSSYKKLSNNDLVDLDFLMTDALILYASHLISGKVEQSKLRSKWDVELNQRPKNIDSLLTVTLHNKRVKEALENVKPQHYFYKLMKFNLKKYRALETNGGWSKVTEGETLKKDVIDGRILEVRKYLLVTGDLKVNDVENDSLYDEVLEIAVKKFQTRHNLTSDGAIGKGTIEQMNVPVKDRIDMLRVNLERMKWVFHNPDEDFLLVNIAGFYVKRFKNKKEIFSSRVIVGKYNRETPIFKGKMQYIIINPTWTLPYSIATHETLPKLKKDPNYLSAKHMEIMDRNGNILNYNNIDFSQYSAGNFPFIIRQKAGPWNALGQVKFIFPNKYSVYLHDTPSRGLFNRQDRAFSHGCIRTENKWELLMSLMDNPEVWNMDKVNGILDSGKTTRINLPEPINIYLMYWTSRVDQENTLYFMKDVYKRDTAVLKALDEPVNFLVAEN
ncbi:MAG: L,D-transpeptidase family protein, partial [Flavobacteriaceae bacterium]|nr:L,D-transpeptidase family protein [Flavobacteriaceae bacterium]